MVLFKVKQLKKENYLQFLIQAKLYSDYLELMKNLMKRDILIQLLKRENFYE